jgi:hypothetical protein
MGVLAGFGDDHLIPSEDIDLVGCKEMLAKEQPEDRGPRDGSGKEALDGAIGAAAVSPPGEAQHSDAAGQGQQGQDNVTELAGRGGREGWHQAGEEW